MALWDEVVSRFSNEKLVTLTNPDNRAENATIDTTLAAFAVADVEADFKLHAETTYDGTDGRHVRIGVQGVIAHLMGYGAAHGEGAAAALDRFHAQLRVLRDTSSRARISPTTDSELEPTDEFEGGGTVRPDFDRDRFTGLVPGNPTRTDPLRDVE
jgi:hypothetical protein